LKPSFRAIVTNIQTKQTVAIAICSKRFADVTI